MATKKYKIKKFIKYHSLDIAVSIIFISWTFLAISLLIIYKIEIYNDPDMTKFEKIIVFLLGYIALNLTGGFKIGEKSS